MMKMMMKMMMMMMILRLVEAKRMGGRTGTSHRSSGSPRKTKIKPVLWETRDDCLLQLKDKGINGTVHWCTECVTDIKRCSDPTGTRSQYEEVTLTLGEGFRQKCILDRASIGGQYVRCRRPYEEPTVTTVVLGLVLIAYMVKHRNCMPVPGLRG